MIAAALSAVLFVIAALHAYWGLGGVWPGTDSASCARAVVGFRGVTHMPPPNSCFTVAAGLALAAFWPLALMGLIVIPFPPMVLTLGDIVMGLIFLGRGLLGYVPGWRQRTSEQPFARLDVRFYSPLCLAIGLGFLLLAFTRLSS